MNWLHFAFTAALAVPAFIGIKNEADALASRAWPSANGIVLVSRIESQEVRSPKAGGGYTTHTLFVPRIQYGFSVENDYFISSRVSFGDRGSRNQADAEAIVSKYPVGSSVTVFYSPDTKSDAVIERVGGAQNYTLIAIGAALALGFLYITKKRKEK